MYEYYRYIHVIRLTNVLQCATMYPAGKGNKKKQEEEKMKHEFETKHTVPTRVASSKDKHVSIRLGAELMTKLKVAAGAENRSVSNWLENLIQRELGEK